MVVLPVGERHPSPTGFAERVSTGNAGLDALTHGGLFRGASTLVTGPTGTGKTLLATQFAGEACRAGESVLLMAYEETVQQVHADGAVLGHDLAAHEDAGLLRIVSLHPEVAGLDDHLVEIRELVERHRPQRLVVDSLSALERLGSAAGYRHFVVGLTSFVKQIGLATLVTASSPDLVGGTSVTESHVSGLVDAVVVLRHVELDGTLERGVFVVKMRGSSHEQAIRRLHVEAGGLRVGEPFEGVSVLGRGGGV